jgi:hypothetical protein
VEAVAETSDRDPADVQPLYSVVDPDVLDALFEYGQAPGWEGSLTFTLDRYRVTLDDAGTITVTPPATDEAAEAPSHGPGVASPAFDSASDLFPAEQ